MIKLVLASYFQPENHASGRKIGISPSKPKDAECDLKFDDLSPGQIYWDYHKYKKDDPEMAGKLFDKAYSQKLDAFAASVLEEATKNNKSVFDILPFKDNDNLLSWEKEGHLTYRTHVAECLRKLGYLIEEK